MYDDYLMHHGIKGMKWGVRRYQNEDRTLTEAGKKRYAKYGGERPSHWKGPETRRYDRLNRRADKGLKRRANGETINWNNQTEAMKSFGTLLAAHVIGRQVDNVFGRNGIGINFANKRVATLNGDTIRRGAVIIEGGLYFNNWRKNRQIRASYMRDSHGKNSRWAG